MAPISPSDPRSCVLRLSGTSTRSSGTSARCGPRRGGEIPEAWFRLPVFYFSNVSEIRGPGDPVWAPRGSAELDYELEVAALVDTPARDLAADAQKRCSAAT